MKLLRGLRWKGRSAAAAEAAEDERLRREYHLPAIPPRRRKVHVRCKPNDWQCDECGGFMVWTQAGLVRGSRWYGREYYHRCLPRGHWPQDSVGEAGPRTL